MRQGGGEGEEENSTGSANAVAKSSAGQQGRRHCMAWAAPTLTT